MNYKDNENRLITYRKNISNLLSIERGDYIISSNILDADNIGGFCKISKNNNKNKKHIGRVLSNIDWDDNQLEQKFDVLYFMDSSGNNRKAVRVPCIISL